MIAFFYIIGGLLLLIAGGEVLVRGAVAIAQRFNLLPFIIGLTIVAYGTSSPEIAISIQAVLHDHGDIALGNIIGSNISNILLVLGVTTLIHPIAIDKKMARRDSYVMVASALILAILCVFGTLTMLSGMLLLMMLLAHLAYLFYARKRLSHPGSVNESEDLSDVTTSMSLPMALCACIIGTLLLSYGGDILVEGAVLWATMLGVPESVIAVTIVALGGSAPELAASIIAALRQNSAMALGNVIGSNIVNILGAMGIASLVGDVSVSSSFLVFDIPLMLIASTVLLVMILFYQKLYRLVGAAFCIIYFLYVTMLFA